MMSCDLAIIGSGPGGYVAALYASRRKMKVCVIEKDTLGGTCLNSGCIPTKSLICSVSMASAMKRAQYFGIKIDGYSIDFEKASSRKEDVVSRLRTGIETLFRVNRIELIKGHAGLSGAGSISVEGHGEIKAAGIIIASGSRPAELPGMKIDHSRILSSDDILKLRSVPKSLAVIGGGVIGCEFAGLFNGLGCKVSIIEMAETLVPGQSREAARKLEHSFKRSGIDVYTSSTVEAAEVAGAVTVRMSGGKSIEAEKVLISVGRAANTEGMGLEQAGVGLNNGRIAVDEYLKTGAGNIYAAGDCIGGPQLAHKASYDGILACDNILGGRRVADYSSIPNCIWTDPEIASVGLSEEAAKARYPDVKVAKFPYLASGKAFLDGETEGFAKIIGTPDGELIGVEIFGKDACNLIGEAVLAKSRGVNIKDWSHVVHGHPTLSEILQEACHAFCGTAIHGV